MMQIYDPIHGYIELDGMFAHIVNTPEFQRLRSVEQGSFRPVYPGARHDRFAHSLGTYHLATKFAEHFFENLKKDAGIAVKKEERERLSLTFRYAALLHDVGHAPFSHTTEDFFEEKKDDKKIPMIWNDLCAAVAQVNGEEGKLFSDRNEKCGAAHEIMSATIMVEKWKNFHIEQKNQKPEPEVDLALAARMVIGFPYSSGDLPAVGDELLGVRNCLIQLLNCSVPDVDRLDYMMRDTQMSGYVNAPLDLACLARSVTAVMDDGMLVNAYREDALRVFDLMFQAKLSHDTWVLAAPAGAYDAALRRHCIRQLGEEYIKTVFTVEALSQEGVKYNGKTYRLLSDVDVEADFKAQRGEPFDELNTREPGKRRTPAWRSYYEFNHIFNCPERTEKRNGQEVVIPKDKQMTPENVYMFFKPLMKYLKEKNIFAFDEAAYQKVLADSKADPKARQAAELLKGFLVKAHSKKENDPDYSVVLLDRTNSFTLKLKPEEIRIVFSGREDGKLRLPLRQGKYNYSTYDELTCSAHQVEYKKDYFYIMRRGGLGAAQLKKLRAMLAKELKK